MKKINGMIDYSERNYFSRLFRGYLIERNVHGYYTTFLECGGYYVQCETIKAIKRAIGRDIINLKNNNKA